MHHVYIVYRQVEDRASAPLLAFSQEQNAIDKCKEWNASALRQLQAEWQTAKAGWDASEIKKETIAKAFANVPKYSARPYKRQMPSECTDFQYCSLEVQD